MNREQLAAEHGMSMEYVNWFFDHKKEGCGNVWFMMMAAMWEGWQAASKASEQQLSESRREFRAADATIHNLEQQLAAVVAENAGLKESRKNLTEFIHDELNADYPLNMDVETPATDAAIANIQAQGVEMFAHSMAHHLLVMEKNGEDAMTQIQVGTASRLALAFAAQLRQGAEHE